MMIRRGGSRHDDKKIPNKERCKGQTNNREKLDLDNAKGWPTQMAVE
jgi:hypothetical protein